MPIEHSPVLGAAAVICAALAILGLIALIWVKGSAAVKARHAAADDARQLAALGKFLVDACGDSISAAYREARKIADAKALERARVRFLTKEQEALLLKRYMEPPPKPSGPPPFIEIKTLPEIPCCMRPLSQVDRSGENVPSIRLVSTAHGIRKTLVMEPPDELPPRRSGDSWVPAGADWWPR